MRAIGQMIGDSVLVILLATLTAWLNRGSGTTTG
jgi:hypothetical protein